MRILRRLSDIAHMARDFYGVISGTDYFHLPDLLGRYFIDGKSYYIDFRGKVNWTGAMDENVPLLFIPALNKNFFHPGMILQYGLGSIDMYFSTGSQIFLENVHHVGAWLFTHSDELGSYNNLLDQLNNNPQIQYYSNNSAMTQGEAISFLTRALRHGMLPNNPDEIRNIIRRIYKNMKLPIEQGGATIYKDGKVYLCEYCRKDEYIVLNGWIFALFGLSDYCIDFDDTEGKNFLRETIDTLADCINSFIVPKDNWSYYDNRKRLCYPPYQITHINQLDALSRLTGKKEFQSAHAKLVIGNSHYNQVKYTSKKVLEKLFDTQHYATT